MLIVSDEKIGYEMLKCWKIFQRVERKPSGRLPRRILGRIASRFKVVARQKEPLELSGSELRYCESHCGKNIQRSDKPPYLRKDSRFEMLVTSFCR